MALHKDFGLATDLHCRRYKIVVDRIFQLHKAMAVQVIQPHKQATSVQAAGRCQFEGAV